MLATRQHAEPDTSSDSISGLLVIQNVYGEAIPVRHTHTLVTDPETHRF